MDGFDSVSTTVLGHEFGLEEDPATRFLNLKENDFTWIENEDFCVLDGGQAPPPPSSLGNAGGIDTTPVNGEHLQPSGGGGPSNAGADVSAADSPPQDEPETLCKWREQQRQRLEALDAKSLQEEAEWKEKAVVELEEWHTRYNDEVKMARVARATEKAMADVDRGKPGTEWEEVARLCDFNPESGKQAKDVSRMRSVLISLKQSPLLR